MADIRSNINVNIDTANALASIKQLQAQISAFHQSLRNSGSAANQAVSQSLTKNLVNSINATKQFSASLTTVNNRTQAFTSALEKNKFSLGQYFRYGMATTKTFGKVFRKEFDTIEQVAGERVKTMQTQFIKLGKSANGAFESIKIRPLALDMQNLGTQVAMTAQKQQLFNKLLDQGSTNLLNFGKNTQWAGRQLMVGLTIPLTLLGSAAMKTFTEMEEQAIRFKRVYGELFTTEAETDAMIQELDKLAMAFTKYGVAVSDTMSLAADAAAMGKMGADLSAQVSEATRLAVLGGVEQSEALRTTISITNAFGTSAEELASKIDFLNAVENQTVVSIEDLTTAIPKAGPVVKQLGGDVEDLAFFLTAMKEGGINASEGANALKSGLARMINPTKVATEVLGQMGININAIVEGNAGNVKATVLELAAALDELDPLSKSRAIEQLFGRFQFARISTLFNNVIKEGNQASRVLELTRATNEELAILSERELKRVEDSPLYKFQRALEEVQKSLMPLGQQFMELITPILQFATRMLEGFNNLDDGVKKFITGAIAALGLVAPVALMTFGLFANGIANLIKGFGVIRGLFLKVAYAGTGLNSQLSYMTQEHLEAASAANALGSTHSNLMNIFTAETSAVMSLINAYNQATVAIQRNNVAAGARVTKGTGGSMKLASGIVSVPGPKGAGDIVPAMLAPGEAVIPAKMAQKYGSLINGMIADNIPGFAQGRRGDARKGTLEARQRRDFIEQFGEQRGNELADAQERITAQERAAVRKAGRENASVTGPTASRYYEQVDGAHMTDKSTGFKYGSTVRAESAVSNNILNSFGDTGDGAIKNRAALEGYLKKHAKSSKETQQILQQLERGVGLSGQNEKLFGKALDDVGADLRSGKATAGKRKGDTFTSGVRYAAPAAAGIAARQKAYDALPPRLRNVLELNEKAVAKGTKATEEDTKATKKKTATTKKATNTTAKSERAEARSAAAKKGWETRRANQAATAGVAPPMSREDKKLMRQQRAQRRAQIGGRAFGALGTASMIAGMGSMMGGPVGDISSKLMGPLMGLSAVAGLLPMLMNPIGLVVGGLAALGAGAFFLNKRFNDQVQKSYELSSAMGTTTEAIEGLAKAAGNATASQILDRRRENAFSPFQVASGKTPFGETFLDSDAGKKLVSSFADSLETFGRDGAMSRIVQQLATAVASGAISAEQARSIGIAFAQKVGDSSMGMNIAANLNSLLGPQGENLLKDPLGIRIKIIESSRREFANMLNSIATVTPSTGYSASASGFTYSDNPRGKYAQIRMEKTEATPEDIGMIIAMSAGLLDQQKQMVDSLQLEYEQRIDNAKAAGDMEEMARLQKEYIQSRNAIMQENATTMGQIVDAVGGLDNAEQVLGKFRTQVETRFKDDPILSQVLPKLFEQINELDVEKQVVLNAQLLAGDIDPMTLANVLNGEESDKIINVITKLGGTQADRALELVRFFEGTKGPTNTRAIMNGVAPIDRATYFLDRLNNLNPAEAMDFLDAFSQVGQLGVLVGEDGLPKLFEYYQDNPDALSSMSEDIDAIANAAASASGDNLTIEVITSLVTEGTTKDSLVEALASNQEYFDGLPDEQKKIYTTVLRTVFETGSGLVDTAEIAAAREGMNFRFGGMTQDQYEDALLSWYANHLAEMGTKQGPQGTGGTGEITDTGTGGSSADPIGDILKRLRSLRDFAINAAGGIDALKNAIKGVDFMGIQQKLTFAGYGQEFISAITSMDEETRKKFVSIENGSLKVTAAGKALAQAYSEVKLGEFQASLVSGLSDVNKQIQAMNILQSRGLSNAEAFDIVKDASLAYAIATSDTTEEVDELIKAFGKLQDAQDELNNSTIAGMEGTLGTAFGNIREFFAAQEEVVNLAFDANTAGDNSILSSAQNDIAALQYVSDDLNYALDQIKEKEDEINERYDKRVKALEQVSAINKDIINQEKGQLDIAQALASGDIAAAAKAVQEYRAEEADRAQQKAKDLLDQAKQNELDAVTAENGKTRLQLETELKDITKQIAEIEESRLEPAQERIRIATVARDIALEAIGTDGYLGKTKDEWAAVENAIRLAKVESEDYKKAIEDALQLIPKLKDAYAGNTGDSSQSDGPQLTSEQQAAIDKIKSNRAAVRASEGTTAADKAMIQENIALIKMLDAAGISRSLFMSGGGKVPKYYAAGGFARGTDSVPAMLTPGEFVVRKYAVDKFGADRLKAINSGAYNGGSMYNSYAVNVNVKSDANPDQIARAVMTQIKGIESQRMRSNRF